MSAARSIAPSTRSYPLPVIGISTYREQTRFRMWDVTADVLHAAYARSVEAAGGAPVLLPPQRAESAAALIARLDGLVISGGSDVDPARYGAEPHPRTVGWRTDRDGWELALLDAANAAGLPLLGRLPRHAAAGGVGRRSAAAARARCRRP